MAQEMLNTNPNRVRMTMIRYITYVSVVSSIAGIFYPSMFKIGIITVACMATIQYTMDMMQEKVESRIYSSKLGMKINSFAGKINGKV